MREPSFEKEQKQQLTKSTGPRDTKSNANGATDVSPVHPLAGREGWLS
jgi:hypothetical protein